MILSLLNKLMFFGTIYLLYQAYNTAGGGVTEILGDLPKIIVWILFALAAAALLFVALLCTLIFFWPRIKPSTNIPPIPSAPTSALPPLPRPRTNPSVLLVGYGASAQALWNDRSALFSASRWACPLQYEALLRLRGPEFVKDITFVQQFSDVSSGDLSVGDMMEGVQAVIYFPLDIPSVLLGGHGSKDDPEIYRNVQGFMSTCHMALSKGVQAVVLCVNQSVNIAPSSCKQDAAGMSAEQLHEILNLKRVQGASVSLTALSQTFAAPTLLFCERGMHDLHLKPTGTQGKLIHCSVVRCCGRVFGEVGDALDVALARNGVVLYHPDCINDYVPAEVVANAVAHAVAAAVEGGGGQLITHNVSLNEPVSQFMFYRMVQTAVSRARAGTPAHEFSIGLGKSVLGRVSGMLYHIGVLMGAKTAFDLQAEGEYSSNAHYASSGRSFSSLRSNERLVSKYPSLMQFVANAVDSRLERATQPQGNASAASGGGGSDHIKAE